MSGLTEASERLLDKQIGDPKDHPVRDGIRATIQRMRDELADDCLAIERDARAPLEARVKALEARVRMHAVANHGATYWKLTDGHMGDWTDCPHEVCSADRAALAASTAEATLP